MPLDATNGRNIVKLPAFNSTMNFINDLNKKNYDNYNVGDEINLQMDTSNTGVVKFVVIAKNLDTDINGETIPLTLLQANNITKYNISYTQIPEDLINVYNVMPVFLKNHIVKSKRSLILNGYDMDRARHDLYPYVTMPSAKECNFYYVSGGSYWEIKSYSQDKVYTYYSTFINKYFKNDSRYIYIRNIFKANSNPTWAPTQGWSVKLNTANSVNTRTTASPVTILFCVK